MSSWYKVTMDNSDLSHGKTMRLQDEFAAIFIASNPPNKVAMFSNRNYQSNNHQFYFSEHAMKLVLMQVLVKAHGGVPCEIPKREDCALLVGYQDAWNMLPSIKEKSNDEALIA